METYYAAADGPTVVIADRFFSPDYALRIVCAPTYGRILFAPHVEIRNCTIFARTDDNGPAVRVMGVQ